MKFLCAALIISAALATPASARHRHHHHHHRHLPVFSYSHNYGPGPLPGTVAFYDGSLRARCAQSAAAYRGQDGRPHPCY